MIMISAVPCSTTSFLSRARICAWMVTSSAVVGSSAISSRGRQASAMAISARCRMPPDSWCGYSLSRRVGSGMPTESSRSRASCMAADRFIPRCRSSTSVTWIPMGTTGFSEDSGSWKIIARSRPRRSRMSSSGSDSRSVPSNFTEPVMVDPRLGSSRMIASEVTDLPQPDSPTSPTVCPGAHREADPVHRGERRDALAG